VMREPWQAESTARNLGLIRAAWARRGDESSWLGEIEAALGAAALA